MKRGKDDEKVMGPLFPRLHVSDTEKGGPRAPPRNKMALYEQFSIPSQRFNPGLLPLHPNTSTITVPPASSSQGTVSERNNVFPSQLPPQTASHRAEKHISRQSSEGANLNASLVQLEQRKKADEDDFMVPVYIRSRIGQSNDKILESFDGKKLTHTGSRYFGYSVAGNNDCEMDPKQYGSSLVNTRTGVRDETDGPPQESSSKGQPLTSARDTSNGENIATIKRQTKVIPNQEFQDFAASKFSRLRRGDACIRQDCGAESQSNRVGQSEGFIECTREADKSNDPAASKTSPTKVSNGTEYHDSRTGCPVQRGLLTTNDNVSKISRVENLTTLNISPDNVVAIIGQKHFWKARKAIANQQRVFAVQVFELHRLIKVQQLIAGSPDLLFEDGAFLGKSPAKGSTHKKLPLEYVVKPRQQNLKRKDDSEKINQKLECSAENAVGKTSLSSVKNGNQLSNHTPFAGNQNQANVATDSGMGPWCFQQPPGHQWLIPVMSPSEGLVYKPYPGPGFTGTNGGGCGPFGAAPLGGTFMNAAYGIPPPQDTPPGSHAYFPPYGGMPVMNAAISESAVEQVNQSSALGSHEQNGHFSRGQANGNIHNQSFSTLPVQRNKPTAHVRNPKKYEEFELQGSTASSPSEMAPGMSTEQVAEGRDVLPLFPMVPAEPEGVALSLETGQQTRVIKVVPHNRRSANESAARIFQSIQDERKQY